MSNLAQWSALVGFLIPLAIAVVQQTHWRRWVRTVIGVVCSLGAAIITAAVENRLTWNTWATSAIWIVTTAMVSYRTIWVPLGAAPTIEAKTTVAPTTPPTQP